MTFLKVRLHSIFAATFIAAMLLPQWSGNLFAQTTFSVSTLAGLKDAIDTIAVGGGSGGPYTITISGTIPMDGNVPELYVPTGITVNIDGTGIISGGGVHRGLVIQTAANTSSVNIEGITFQNCVATGGDGGDGQVGGGGGAGLGGAIYVRGTDGNVSLTDVTFTGNEAKGGAGGEVLNNSKTAGGGGGVGGDGGGDATGGNVYVAGGGGGFGENADGGTASSTNGGSGISNDPALTGGDGLSNTNSSQAGNGGNNGGGGGGAYGATNNYAAGGGGGEGGGDAVSISPGNYLSAGNGGYGGGGGGSSEYAGTGGFGGGGGGGNLLGGNGGFGGGGGGSLDVNKGGNGGYGAGNSDGASGGGGLGAGGDLYVEGGVRVTVDYTSATTSSFNTSSATGGTGANGAGSGDALGAIFLNGNNITFDGTNGNTVSGNINDISATSNFDKTNAADIQAHAGGIIITGTDAVTLKGNNTYAGVTQINSGATLVADGVLVTDANGKKVNNAIGDLSEVQVTGSLYLNKDETIGFLSGSGDVYLHDNTAGTVGGKTLIIAGDEDSDPARFGLGYNPATGAVVDPFSGKFVTDGDVTTKETLIKTGTGRLILSGDNTDTHFPLDEFTTTIYQGTIVLSHAAGLGGGNVTVKNIDTGTGDQLRNIIEAGTGLAPVLNNFQIATSGKDLDGVQRTFNDFVIGGANNIQFGNGTTAAGGQISGGNVLVNMDAAANKVILANEGHNGTVANLNNYSETRIKNGTVVVNPHSLGSGGDTLGNGSVRAYAMQPGDTAILSAAVAGMTIDNHLIFDKDSALTLSNETAAAAGYTLSGNTSGAGDMIVNTTVSTTTVTMTGALMHTGATHITNGVLQISPSTNRNTTLYNLSAGTTGALDVTSGDLYANVKSGDTAVYSGTITLSGTNQTLYKTGSGTWIFDRGSAIIATTAAINVNAGALQLNKNNDVQNVVLSGNGGLIVNNAVTLANLTSGSLTNNVTINGSNTLTLTTSGTTANGNTLYNTWTGGTGASVAFLGNTTLRNMYQNGTTWDGTMIVGNGTTGAILTVASPGALGNSNEAQVTLNQNSTLVVDTHMNGYYPTTERIKQLNINGAGTTVDTRVGSTLTTETIAGSHDVTKDGIGTWAMLSASTFANNIDLTGGTIHLQRMWDASTRTYLYNADMGTGDLNVTGTGTSLRVDVGDTTPPAPKVIDNDIVLGNTLNVFIIDYSTNGNTVDFTGDISGAGGIDYWGNGTMVFNGAGTKTYAGPTNVNSGTLQVDVNTTNTSYNVNNGGILSLNGISTGTGGITVNNGGTLTGTGSINTGALTFNNGSNLIVDGSGATTYDVNGNNVNIQNGAVAHVSGNSATGVTGFITNAGTTTGSFWFTDEIQGQRAVGNWNGSGGYDISFEPVNYMNNTQSAGAQSLGNYLSAIADNSINGQFWGLNHSIPINTLTSNLLNDLENVTPGMYDYALLEVGGQINASMVTAQTQTTSNMLQSITKQLYPIEQFAGESRGTIRGQSMRSGWTGWTNTLGVYGDTSGNGKRGTFGYDFETYGMSIGFEPTSAMAVNRLGMFYAYNYTDIDTNQSIGSGQIKSNFFGTYGRFVDSMGYTSFVAGFGFDDYKSNRSVLVPALGGDSRSEFDGWQGGFYIERGLNQLAMTRFGLQPYVGLQYLHLSTDDFAETGSNQYKLITESSDANSLRTNFGVRFARQVTRVKRGTMHMTGNVSWMHEFLDADCLMTSRWAASNNPSTFGVRGNSLGRDWAVLGAGVDWSLRQNLSVFGSYDLQVNGYQTLNVANVGARLQW